MTKINNENQVKNKTDPAKKYYDDTKKVLQIYRDVQLAVNSRVLDHKDVNDPVNKANERCLTHLKNCLEAMLKSKSKKENEFYKVIYLSFLDLNEPSDTEIMEILEINSTKTLYSLRKQAIESLSVKLWGIGAIKGNFERTVAENYAVLLPTKTLFSILKKRDDFIKTFAEKCARLLPVSKLKQIVKEREPNTNIIDTSLSVSQHPRKKVKKKDIYYIQVPSLPKKKGRKFNNEGLLCPRCGCEIPTAGNLPILNGRWSNTVICSSCGAKSDIYISVICDCEPFKDIEISSPPQNKEEMK